jgi:hypothetical protein
MLSTRKLSAVAVGLVLTSTTLAAEPNPFNLYDGLANVQIAITETSDRPMVLVNGEPVENLTYLDVREELTQREIVRLSRMIANDPVATDNQTSLTTILRDKGLLGQQQEVMGVMEHTIYYIDR